ncbi:MAG: C69 family dipeptidase [Bacteroidota bacterium]|nr:C69 family dipeptidase [Bacteroidota bacterium]MDP4204922.1 C69 family dipeptidase [Bacteroidota bacterium]
MKKSLSACILFLLAGILVFEKAEACTNFLIAKGATVDGSTMITYAADSHTLFGELYFRPATDYPDGALVDVNEWDTGKHMGKIKQVRHTYSVVGNMNEHQLAIGETTFGGRKELQSQSGAIVDYGSLIYLALQRAKTAREAINVMTSLVEEYGYASEGESFSIADPNEVWILEMISKGEGEKGALWVAQRIPDGCISGHANQARITTFPLNDSKNCMYAKDVISFARNKGLFSGKDSEFSFSDTYAPVDFSAARFCDARVWSGFNKVNGDMKKYEQYVLGVIEKGANGYATNRMPLWIKPDHKLTVQDVINLMRDHYEGTALDMSKDLGAGPYNLPYRWRPMTWKVDGVEYCHERATSTQQTGFSFVAQCRGWLPAPIGGIFWFGVDDTYSTCYTPIYCGSTRTPESFSVGNGDMLTYNWNSAFWVFNTVANFTYLRYSDMIKDVQKVQQRLEQKHFAITPAVDEAALKLWNSGKQDLALEFITDYSVNTANNMTTEWQKLAQYLLVKYKDGNIMKEKNGKFERNEWGMPVSPNQPNAPEWWYKAIIQNSGDHLKVK